MPSTVPPSRTRRLAPLRERDFRRFFAGYTTSLFGSSMASIALTFAVLETGGGGPDLGWVLTARLLPLLLMLPAGGVVTDRLGSRRVMLAADAVRCLSQLALALLLLRGDPGLWTFAALVGVWGAAEALFGPALGALVPHIVSEQALPEANALLGVCGSAAAIAGPALAGVLIAAAGASSVLALDAASYAVGLGALLLLPGAAVAAPAGSSLLSQLRQGWQEFSSRTWLWVTTAHVCLFNLLVWAPFLVLGPVVAQRRLDGAGSWGLVMALYGSGAVAGGLVMLGRRPRRPVLVATAASAGWALPPAALAAGRSLPWICAGALCAGVSSAVCGTLYTTAAQRQLPQGALARVNAYTTLGAYGLGPIGLAAAGPLAATVGASRVLGFGALWQVTAVVVVISLPAVRAAPARARAVTGVNTVDGEA